MGQDHSHAHDIDHQKAGDSIVRLVDFIRSMDRPTASQVSWILGEAKILTEACAAGWRPDDCARLADRLVTEAADAS